MKGMKAVTFIPFTFMHEDATFPIEPVQEPAPQGTPGGRRIADVRPDNELWLDRSVMAIEAAVDGLGVVLESEVLAAEELSDGRLIAPFDDSRFSIDVTSYYLVRSRGYNTSSQAATAFENWLRSAFNAANLTSKLSEM